MGSEWQLLSKLKARGHLALDLRHYKQEASQSFGYVETNWSGFPDLHPGSITALWCQGTNLFI